MGVESRIKAARRCTRVVAKDAPPLAAEAYLRGWQFSIKGHPHFSARQVRRMLRLLGLEPKPEGEGKE